MVFLKFNIATLCLSLNLINLAKQQILVKAWGFTKNRLRHSMEIKEGFITDSITAIYSKGLQVY